MGEERVILEGADLEKVLAHRGRNLIIDRDECFLSGGEPFGRSTLSLQSGDPAGRDIFLRESASGGRAIMEFAFTEHLALNAICVLESVGGGLEEGDLCYFASITNFRTHREVPEGMVARGAVSRKSDKGPFCRFKGEMSVDSGDPVAEADITSFTLHGSEESPRDMRKAGEVVPAEMSQPVERASFGWKRPDMVFVDEMITFDAAGKTAGFAYTYPGDHPFTIGHFPGNPVMMGITEWMSVSDAVSALVMELGRRGDAAPGTYIVGCSGELLRDDGTIVTEVKGMKKKLSLGNGGELGPPEILATRRVVFRDIVRPAEPLRVRARIDSLEDEAP